MSAAMMRRGMAFGAITAALLLSAGAASAASAPATAPATRGPSSSVKAPPMVLPFIDDDYDRALAEARRLKIPIFIEAWAPW